MLKLLGDQLPAYQVAWFRFAGMVVLMLPFLLWRYGAAGLIPARPWVQVIRGLTLAGSTTLFVIAHAPLTMLTPSQSCMHTLFCW